MVSKGQLICLLLASIFANIVSASKLQDSDGAPCYEKDENGEDLTKAQVITFTKVVRYIFTQQTTCSIRSICNGDGISLAKFLMKREKCDE